MSEGRRFAGVTELDGRLYVVGGNNSWGQALKSMECYDPATNTWSSKVPLLNKVRNFGVN